MCDCIEKLVTKYKEFIAENKPYKKEVDNVVMGNAVFAIGKKTGNVTDKTYSVISVSLVGQKKKSEQMIMNTFCPFCGEKYPKNEG